MFHYKLDMNPLELFPEAATWNVDKLLEEINEARKELDNKRELSAMNKYYLCGILADYSPKAISQKLNLRGDGCALRTALSTEINPYIRELLNYPEALEGYNFWGNARRELEKAGYKNLELSPDSQDSSVTKIKLDYDNPSMADVEKILAKIRQVTRDESIKIQDIRRGCIELVLSGSEVGLKRLESLVKSGELQEIAGVRVISAESTTEPSKVVRLSNWLENLVESGWEALEHFLSPQQLALRSDDAEVSRNNFKGKLIERTMLRDGFSVVLVVGKEQLDNGFVNITLQLCPIYKQAHLPEGIKLRMFGDEVSTDIQASSEDEWIELRFAGEPGEEFGVKIVKGDVSVVENFVI